MHNLEYKQDINKWCERTWQEAFSNDKVCCPHQRCTDKTALFNEAGLEQHYRAVHEKIGEVTMKEAQAVSKK